MREGKFIHVFLHHGSKYFLLEQNISFESINSWVLVFYLIPIQSFYSSSWSLFQLYGEFVNVSYIVALHHWSLCVKRCLSHFCVVLTVQGLNLCRPFCSFLDLLCRPFPGISSLHHVFNISCREIQYQFQIQLVFDLPHVG